MAVDEIALLADIVPEVVELATVAVEEFDQLPVTHTDGSGRLSALGAVMRVVPEERAFFCSGYTRRRLVKLTPSIRFGTSTSHYFQHGGKIVDAGHGMIDDGSGAGHTGP